MRSDKADSQGKHDATATPAAAPGEHHATTGTGAAHGEGLAATAGQTAQDLGEKAKSALGYGLVSLSSLSPLTPALALIPVRIRPHSLTRSLTPPLALPRLASLARANTQAQLQALGKQIDDRTATADQPGLLTRASAAYHSGVEQLEKAVGAKDHAGSTANLTTAEEGSAPIAGSLNDGPHPITTTTNAIPHAESAAQTQKTEEGERAKTGESVTAPPKA